MSVRPVGVITRDLEGVIENFERSDIAVIAVVVIRVGLGRLSHRPDDLQVPGVPQIDIFGSSPPVERLLIMRPCLAPILYTAPRPPKIAERLLRFCPDPIVIFCPPPLADDRFKLPLRRFVSGVVGGLRRPPRPPLG